MKTHKLLAAVFVLIGSISWAQDKNIINKNYSYEVIVPDLLIPWGFVFLQDQSMLITEKRGELIHLINGKKTIIDGLPEIKVQGEGGLMDIELHPNYAINGWIYISYASEEGEGSGANTAIMRFKIKDNILVEKKVLYKASPNSKSHFTCNC